MEEVEARVDRMLADVRAIEEVAAWLRELGLGNGSDRLHKYVSEIQKQSPLPASVQEVAELGFIYLEAREFVDVCRAYKGREDSRLIVKLDRALKGSHRLAEESLQNNDARNTMFELALAASLRLRGVDVELGEPDLTINFPKGQYVVEGKRPFRETGLRANVKDAERQLRANLRPGQHGVIAISLNRIINPGSSVLAVEVGGRDKLGVIHGTLQSDLHRRCCRLMSGMSTLRFSPNIAALMFDVSTPCLTEKGEALAHGSRFYPTDEPRSIMGKLRGLRNRATAFSYLDNKMDEVLSKEFSAEGQVEIDHMNRIAQTPAGFFAAISKQ
jgi:hypothetical protein